MVQRVGHQKTRLVSADKRRCTCRFVQSMHLPCRHIMCARNSSREERISADDCHSRWGQAAAQRTLSQDGAAATTAGGLERPPRRLEEPRISVADMRLAEIISLTRIYVSHAQSSENGFEQARAILLSGLSQLGILDGRANNSNAVVDGQRPHLGEENGASARDDPIAASEPSQIGNGTDEPRDPAIPVTRGRPKKRRARPGDLTEAARTVLRRLDSAEFIADRQQLEATASVAETQPTEEPTMPTATVTRRARGRPRRTN